MYLFLFHEYGCFVYMHVCTVCMQCPPEEGTGYPGTGVTGSCQLPCWLLGVKPSGIQARDFDCRAVSPGLQRSSELLRSASIIWKYVSITFWKNNYVTEWEVFLTPWQLTFHYYFIRAHLESMSLLLSRFSCFWNASSDASDHVGFCGSNWISIILILSKGSWR